MSSPHKRLEQGPQDGPLLAICRREAHILWRSRRFILILSLTIPIVYALFFCALYAQRKIAHIPVTIVDLDHSRLSRQITTAILASETFTLGQYAASTNEFRSLAVADKSHVCFTFAPNFERDLLAGRPVKVAVWVDATNIAIANVAINAASDLIGTFSAGMDIRRSRMQGNGAADADIAKPVDDEYRIQYNPALNGNYANFMIASFVCVAIQLLTVLLAAESISSEIERGDVDELRSISAKPWPVIIGKALVYLCLMLPTSLASLVLPTYLGDVPFRGDPLIVALTTTWFIVIVAVAGIGMSAWCRQSMLAVQMLAIIVMPSYLLSGFTWPTTSMPFAVQALSNVEPISHYLMIYRRITMMAGSWADIHIELLALSAWTIVAAAFAYAKVNKVLGETGGPDV
ncbi:MAG: ABC transporter permease [Capsulimonadaceae bacterium]|nr:ABC transporter permease [Capsulimonadaceae bacterium]